MFAIDSLAKPGNNLARGAFSHAWLASTIAWPVQPCKIVVAPVL
jgi:hypothetical protein